MHETRPIEIIFYTKPGCHLCEDVADVLDMLAARWSLQIRTVDILSDSEIHRRYWSKIPVVSVGRYVLEAPITPSDIQSAVLRTIQEQP